MDSLATIAFSGFSNCSTSSVWRNDFGSASNSYCLLKLTASKL